MTNALKKRVGALIAAAREQAGISQADLAEKVGMYETSISHIERGAKLPTLESLLDIAEALRRPVQDFIPAKPSPSLSRERAKLEAQMGELLRALSDKKLEAAYEMLSVFAKVK